MDDRNFAPIGKLYRLDASGQCTVADEGFIIVNGIAWSSDNRTMYVADTRRDVVYSYDFDMATGAIGEKRHGSPPRRSPDESMVQPSHRMEPIGAPMSAVAKLHNTIPMAASSRP